MSLRIILSDASLTINEELSNVNVYNYVNEALKHFDNIDEVSILMIINTGVQLIEIKIK